MLDIDREHPNIFATSNVAQLSRPVRRRPADERQRRENTVPPSKGAFDVYGERFTECFMKTISVRLSIGLPRPCSVANR